MDIKLFIPFLKNHILYTYILNTIILLDGGLNIILILLYESILINYYNKLNMASYLYKYLYKKRGLILEKIEILFLIIFIFFGNFIIDIIITIII